jgi:hypothetical protein
LNDKCILAYRSAALPGPFSASLQNITPSTKLVPRTLALTLMEKNSRENAFQAFGSWLFAAEILQTMIEITMAECLKILHNVHTKK